MARWLTTFAISCAFLTYLIAEIRGNTSLLQIGSYNLCAEDVAVVPLVAALLSRLDVGRFGLPRILLCLALLLALFNLLLGVSDKSFAALFEFRSRAVFLLFLGIILARWSTLRPLEYLAFPLVAGAMAFLIIYGIRFAGGPLVFVDPKSFGAIYADYLEGRLINAETVIFLGTAAAFFLNEGARSSSHGFRRLAFWVLAIICVIVVLLSRQRTATAAVVVGLGTFFLLHPTLLGVKRTVRVLIVSLLSVLLIAAVAASDVLELFPQEFRESILKRDTLEGRFEIWTNSLAAFSGWDFWWQALGRPAGKPLILLLDQGDWVHSVHNAYLGFLLNYGIVGALLWTALLLAALISAFRPSQTLQTADIEPSVAASWLITLLIYGFSYEWRNAAGVLLGIAMVPLIRHKNAWAHGRAESFILTGRRSAGR
jgi:O-antigen ligase